jgi:hypothetical protein
VDLAHGNDGGGGGRLDVIIIPLSSNGRDDGGGWDDSINSSPWRHGRVGGRKLGAARTYWV